jgi:ribonuclease BN (tRNA processing enzyme)
MSGVRVRFLGTGDPFAPGGRLQACILIESDAGRVLLDCGATALAAMARYDIDPSSIDAILLTHLHGDHFGGLPFFILGEWLKRVEGYASRSHTIRIGGPAETEERVTQVMGAFGYGSYYAAREAGMVEFLTLEPGQATAVGPVTATAFPVPHTPEATALRVTCGDRMIAYSGDTAWTDTLLDVAADADLFICLAYTFERQSSLINYRTLMQQRPRLTCKRLVLTHLSDDMQRHLSEVTEEVAEDGLVIEL